MAGRPWLTPVRKSIFDPVHGPIPLSGPALRLVATPGFQRLWGIRQTGLAHLVFPGANHTRLEHSLGTSWVARRMAERFALDPATTERVAAAALLHDLGHGPFSHTLDAPMHEVLGVGHERLSRDRIEGSYDGGRSDPGEIPRALEAASLRPRDVADLVDPTERARPPALLGSILHGAIDADRVDYLQRDAHYTGVAHGAVDAVRLLDTLRVRRGTPYFAEKGRSAVEGFLVGRALMYSSVYYHKTVRAAELMAQAAVERSRGYPEAARPVFGWTDAEFLVKLRDGGPVSSGLIDGLLGRRLYKRVVAIRSVNRSVAARWKALVRSPSERRAFEDRLAELSASPPASVLVDLSGLESRGAPGTEWGRVAVGEPGRVRYPFRGKGPWRTLATRPPSEWAVSVYVAPALRRKADRRLTERAVGRALG